MSRYYNMAVMIKGADPSRHPAIRSAASQEWDFTDWDSRDDFLMASADDRLCGGETEEEFAERLAGIIFRAHGGPCEVEVVATYLEDIPCDSYTFGPDDYARLTAP
jgi:hypothetical protein